MDGLWIANVVVLPAYAGMILNQAQNHLAAYSAPRVCGDDPSVYPALAAFVTCSPRMRG